MKFPLKIDSQAAGVYDISPAIIQGFLERDECRRLVGNLQKGKKVSGRLRPSIRKDSSEESEIDLSRLIRNNTVCWLKQTKNTSWIYDGIRRLMKEVNESIYQFAIDDLQTIQLTEYKSSGENGTEFYRSHMDTCTMGLKSQRKLSITIQLTSPEEYEGGDLLLFGDQNDIVLDRPKLEKNLFHRRQLGTAIIFPSFYEHEITAVTRGTRHSLVAWMEGPNWK